MSAFAEAVARSPELFPLSLDARSEAVTIIRLTREDYDRASFLDERMLGPGRSTRMLSCLELEQAVESAALPENSDYIFHIGHVGSTLMSRLLGAHRSVFSLREPAVLRTLAQIRWNQPASTASWTEERFGLSLTTFLRLYSRTFEVDAKPIVKATSFVSEIAAEILSRKCQPRALLMFVRAESYLATILGGENAPTEARALAPMRRRRLEHRLGRSLDSLSPFSIGELIALGWLCEMSALAAARRCGGERSLAVNFEAFLAKPEETLAECFRHLRLSEKDQIVADIVAGPLMRRYAKAPEHAYDSALRSAVLDQARATWGSEIRRGLDWLEALAKKHVLVDEALELAGG